MHFIFTQNTQVLHDSTKKSKNKNTWRLFYRPLTQQVHRAIQNYFFFTPFWSAIHQGSVGSNWARVSNHRGVLSQDLGGRKLLKNKHKKKQNVKHLTVALWIIIFRGGAAKL